jgi:four helix bundle protein
MKSKKRVFDLEARLVSFAVAMLDLADRLPARAAFRHITNQMVRSGTSPAPNYAEALSAESRRDFVHKVKLVLKELRETRVWLLILMQRGMVQQARPALAECEELIRIFATSIRTAQKRTQSKAKR